MFRIISQKLLELFHTRTISAVKWHFTSHKLSAAILSGNFFGGIILPCSAAPVVTPAEELRQHSRLISRHNLFTFSLCSSHSVNLSQQLFVCYLGGRGEVNSFISQKLVWLNHNAFYPINTRSNAFYPINTRSIYLIFLHVELRPTAINIS